MKPQLTLIKSENFGNVKCDFWQGRKNDILMTREQIGQALGYSDPDKAIDVIHRRHKDRLDKFSTTVKLTVVEGGREVTRDVVVYFPKGVYEICRYSRQPKADAFMDWAWDAIESIRKTGSYSTKRRGSFPWLDSLNSALSLDTKLTKNLSSKPEKLHVQTKLILITQNETGHDYSEIISTLEASAAEQKAVLEQKKVAQQQKEYAAAIKRSAKVCAAIEKMTQQLLKERAAQAKSQAKEEARQKELEESSVVHHAKEALFWMRKQFAKNDENISCEKDGYLILKYELFKNWAVLRNYDPILVVRELHRMKLVRRFPTIPSGGRYAKLTTMIPGRPRVAALWFKKGLFEAYFAEKEGVEVTIKAIATNW